MSYVLHDSGGPLGVFTGGSLLFGTTGRTDLLGKQHAHDLAHRQHASARRLADLLPDGARVWPTHGFGSFCSATQSDARRLHHRARAGGEPGAAAGGRRLRRADCSPGWTPTRRTTPTWACATPVGAELVDLTPATRRRPGRAASPVDGGEWVVDLRSRTAFARRHLAGTVSVGLDGAMSHLAGLARALGRADHAARRDRRRRSQRPNGRLARIGIDRPAAAATGGPEQWAGGREERLSTMRVATFADLAAAGAGRRPDTLPAADVVLDVRLAGEWGAGHLDGAVHIPLPELPGRLGEVPAGVVWVHCAAGYRAAVAASLLARAGRDVVCVDDSFDTAARGPASSWWTLHGRAHEYAVHCRRDRAAGRSSSPVPDRG